MVTTEAIVNICNYFKCMISHARYKCGEEYRDVQIDSITVEDPNTVVIAFLINASDNDLRISEIKFVSKTGEVWIRQSENIVRRVANEGIYYRYRVSVS